MYSVTFKYFIIGFLMRLTWLWEWLRHILRTATQQ